MSRQELEAEVDKNLDKMKATLNNVVIAELQEL